MSRTGYGRWPIAAGGLTAVLALGLMLLAAHRADGRIREEADRAAALAVAGYFSLVTPADPEGGYRLERLLSDASLVAASPLRGVGLQVGLGRSALLPDRVGLAPLEEDVRRSLETGYAAVRVERRRAGSITLVPLLDRDLWESVGWVGAWRVVRPGSLLRSAAPFLLASLVTLAGALWFARPAADRRLRRMVGTLAAAAALVVALDLGVEVHRTAVAATDAILLRTRGLIELAGTGRRLAPTELQRIAPGIALRPGAPTLEVEPRAVRREVDGRPEAVTTARLRGEGLELVAPPAERRLQGLWAGLGGAWLLFLGGLGFAAWGAAAARDRRAFREALTAWGFLGPAAAHLAVFSFGPLLFAVYLSFHRWGLVEPVRPFVGLENFRLVFGDPRFWHSLRVTAVYSLYVPVTLALALAAAVALDRSGLGVRWLRTILFLPFVSSVVAVALVWQWLYQPDFGLLNALLRRLGLAGLDWLGDPRTALPALMLLSVWVHVGYQMVILLGGLQAIPVAYYDAARVDGAGAWQRFRHVTLPLLRPTILFVLVTGVLNSFQVFTYVSVMTEGGPLYATDVVVYRIYREAWEFLRFGTASAMSLSLLMLLLALTWLQFRWLGRRVELV